MKIIEKFKKKSLDLKGAAPVTIAFLGDSVTQGCFDMYMPKPNEPDTYFDAENAYHSKVRRIFNMLYPQVPVNIINAGISGGCAAEGLARLERDVLKFSPDLCVVCFGLNDSNSKTIEEYTDSMRAIFDTLQENGTEVIHMTPNMMCTYMVFPEGHPFRAITQTCLDTQTGGTLERFLEAAKQIAEEKNIPVCDCYAKWKTMAEGGVNTTALLANKINHPIEDMNWLFAYSVVETMFN